MPQREEGKKIMCRMGLKTKKPQLTEATAATKKNKVDVELS